MGWRPCDFSACIPLYTVCVVGRCGIESETEQERGKKGNSEANISLNNVYFPK